MDLNFRVEAHCGETHARLGRFQTSHGEVETPIFMPVGTMASVKGLTSDELEDLGAQIILGNTYHLAIRPGIDVLRALGGMHTMAHWRRSILTDSGGFQILSLASRRKISEEGVKFQNHIDGGALYLTPEHAIELQQAIGSDIAMCLDHLPPSNGHPRVVEEAMARTTRWALRCLEARKDPKQALFAIIQGGTDVKLRHRHVEELCQHPFDGFAVGGLSVGESIPEMYATLEETAPRMPWEKPRYLMGVGTPKDLVEGVARGVDMFDCVMPTRNARKGYLFIDRGRRKIKLKNARFKTSREPIDSNCSCYTCQRYSTGYLRHQMLMGELVAGRLLSIHNLHVYLTLMADIRRALRQGTFPEFYREWKSGLPEND
ncbi:MAG: tRNA guanosine(34) transglycosylase Tgt [Bradymonadia bacterium]